MKQIKCVECSHIWYADDDNIELLTVCPFCGKKIRKEVKTTNIDNLGKAIYQAVSMKGLEILSSTGKITGFLLDIAQGTELKREIKIFSNAFDDDYLRRYREVFNKKMEDAESTLKRLEQTFVDEEGLSEEWAKTLCVDCLKAVKYYKGIEEELIFSAEVADFAVKLGESSTPSKEKDQILTNFKQYIDRAKQGDAEAQYKIGKCYFQGDGVNEDKEKAFEWYMKAANQGNSMAQHQIGICYDFGIGIDENSRKAFGWYIKAAKQGNPEAQCEVALCYVFGIGVDPDEEKAFEWCMKAAKQGNSKAQFLVGGFYASGSIVDEDEEKAFRWYMKAAQQGDPMAQYEVGDCYHIGSGVDEDEEKAFEWYMKAAQQGFPKALHEVGECYDLGIGVDEDEEKSIEWYKKAVRSGDEAAAEELE